MQPFFWVCAECGWKTQDLIDSCPNCKNRIWAKINRDQGKESEQGGGLTDPGQTGDKAIASYLKVVSELVN